MRVPKEYIKIISSEFQYVAKKMDKLEDPFKKLYYFSATFGVLVKVFNFHYDGKLVFIHQVLQQCYNVLNT